MIYTNNYAETSYFDEVMVVWSFLILVYLYPFVLKYTQNINFWILKANERLRRGHQDFAGRQIKTNLTKNDSNL